jgi:hypothetical protein
VSAGLFFESIQGLSVIEDWIDSSKRPKEAVMHPVNYLFEEIYRDHWGIPQAERPARKRRDAPAWQILRPVRAEPRK